ncbi:MAG: PH domain-containing protein [Clostridia bacterium]|nr:PH domain-containing protein [Clostridia bacterium]
MQYTPLEKNAKKVMLLTAVIQAVAFSAVVLGVLYWFIGEEKLLFSVAIAAAVIVLLWVIFVPMVRFKRYRYMITPDRIEVIEGVFWIKRTVVPIDRVHQISVSKGPIDSAFGVAKVQVITAGSTAVMRFLNEEKANEIAMYLNNKVNEKLGGGSDVQ